MFLNLVWGNFSFPHIISLVYVLFAIVGVLLLLKENEKPQQTIILFMFSLVPLMGVVINMLTANNILLYLPLHMCSFTAMLCPIMVITKNNKLANILFFWGFGALSSIIFNDGYANINIFSFKFMLYFFPHVFEFVIPFVVIISRRNVLNIKHYSSVIITTMLVFSVAHCANMTINYVLTNNIFVDYMFTMGTNRSFIIKYLYDILPYAYWYMYLLLPLILLIVYIIYKVSSIIYKLTYTRV